MKDYLQHHYPFFNIKGNVEYMSLCVAWLMYIVIHAQIKKVDMEKYSDFGRMMTGFDNSSDHAFYGHHSNPEYQQNQQMEGMSEEEYKEYTKKQSEKEQEQKQIGEEIDESMPF